MGTEAPQIRERGWRSRLVRIPRAGGTPAVLQLRSGGIATHFSAHGAVETAEVSSRDGVAYVRSTWNRLWHPFVMEPKDTHLHVVRGGGDSGGIARWYLRSVPLEDLRELAPVTLGRRNEVLIWSGGRRTFSFTFSDKEEYRCGLFFSDPKGNIVQVDHEGTFRGRITLPGRGFLTVRSLKDWTLKQI
jgi:hypothetical protein